MKFSLIPKEKFQGKKREKENRKCRCHELDNNCQAVVRYSRLNQIACSGGYSIRSLE